MPQMICTTCHYVGKPIKKTPGSFAVELVLWLFIILPGLLYSIWRISNKQKICPKCKNPTMIPADSPAGKELMRELVR
ncbi:MAG TPA: hypothetical protein VFX17_02060 [Patescibacteria group bacterium]|nr:hypothetical protein [Patescibacteria group bacterium]